MALKFLGEGGLGEGIELRDQQGTDMFINKFLKENNVYRFWAPLRKNAKGDYTISTANMIGRSLDYKKLGYSFVLVDYIVNDQGARIDVSGLSKLERISSILYDAEYEREIALAERDAVQAAEDMRRPLDVVKLNNTQKDINARYYGVKVNDMFVPPKENKAVSGTVVYVATSLMGVRLGENSTPDDTSPSRVALELSKRKANQFKEVLNSITQADIDRGYVECTFSYKGKDRSECGREAKFEYVEEKNWLQNTHKLWWQSKGFEAIDERLLRNQESIANKNSNLIYSPQISDIFVAFHSWAKDAEYCLSYIDTTKDIVKGAAKDMLEIDVFSDYEDLKAKLIAIVEESTKDKDTVEEEKAINEDVTHLAESDDIVREAEGMTEEEYAEATASETDEPSAL